MAGDAFHRWNRAFLPARRLGAQHGKTTSHFLRLRSHGHGGKEGGSVLISHNRLCHFDGAIQLSSSWRKRCFHDHAVWCFSLHFSVFSPPPQSDRHYCAVFTFYEPVVSPTTPTSDTPTSASTTTDSEDEDPLQRRIRAQSPPQQQQQQPEDGDAPCVHGKRPRGPDVPLEEKRNDLCDDENCIASRYTK